MSTGYWWCTRHKGSAGPPPTICDMAGKGSRRCVIEEVAADEHQRLMAKREGPREPVDECALCGRKEREHDPNKDRHYYQEPMSTDAIGVVAQFNTAFFSFDAFGFTHAQALEVLRAAWKKHAQEMPADANFLEEYLSDVHFVHIIMGRATRDGEEIYREKRRVVIPTTITL